MSRTSRLFKTAHYWGVKREPVKECIGVIGTKMTENRGHSESEAKRRGRTADFVTKS